MEDVVVRREEQGLISVLTMEYRPYSRRISQLYDTALASSGLKTTQCAILAQIGRLKRGTNRPLPIVLR